MHHPKRQLLLCLYMFLSACGAQIHQVGRLTSQPKCLGVLPLDVRFDSSSYDEIFTELLALDLIKRGISLSDAKAISTAYRVAKNPLPPVVDAYYAKKIGSEIQADFMVYGALSRVYIPKSHYEIVERRVHGDVVKLVTDDPDVRLILEIFILDVNKNQIVWMGEKSDVISSTQMVDWMSNSSQSFASALIQNLPLARSQTSANCAKLPQPKIEEGPVQKQESHAGTTIATFTEEQKKLLQSIEQGYKLSDDLFEGRTDKLTGDGILRLKPLKELLMVKSELKLKLTGHVDATADISADLNLSVRRAKAIYDVLAETNLDKQRITYSGVGGSAPVVPNLNQLSRRLNRFVEVMVVP